MSFVEGKKVKAVEGVSVSEEDREKLGRDREMGVIHWNNIKDEEPKEKKGKRKGERNREREGTDSSQSTSEEMG